MALEAGFGVAFGGSLTAPDGVHHFSPGPTAFIGLDWRLVDAPSYFVNFTSALSFSAARSHLGDEASVPYEAFDLRLGGELGFNVAKVLHPYAIARLFGGPVFWRYAGESVTARTFTTTKSVLGSASRSPGESACSSRAFRSASSRCRAVRAWRSDGPRTSDR